MRDVQDGSLIGIQGVLKNLLGHKVQVVGRLVQNQEIGLGEHEFGKRNPSFLAAGQIRDLFKNRIPGKQERGEQVADLRVGHIRMCVADFLKDGIFVIQDMVLLIVVAHVDVGAEAQISVIRLHQLIQNTKNRGFACPVVTDQCHMFTAADVEGDAGEEEPVIEAFGKILDVQNIPAAADTGCEHQMHIVPERDGAVYLLHLIQHFLAALGALDGLLPVELAELGDDLLLMFALRLIIQEGFPFFLPQRFAPLGIGRVVAGKDPGMCVLDFDDGGHCAIQEIAVVGHNQNRPAIVHQIVLEPADAADIEMVGRLVENDQIGFQQQKFSERHAGFLAAGENADLPAPVLVREAEAAQNTGDFTPEGIAVFLGEAPLKLCIFFNDRGSIIGLHFLLKKSQPGLHRNEITADLQKFFFDGVSG